MALHVEGFLATSDRAAYGDACPIDRSSAVFARRSTILLLREASFGTSRFDEFVHRTGLTESIVATQLRNLVSENLMSKRSYQEPGQRSRFEYELTEAGHDLVPVLLALGAWGDRHRPMSHRMRMVHDDCGAPLHFELRCEAGHHINEPEVAVSLARHKSTC